ncbi:LysE family translocator [Novosphingobium decolorationis]|uniref:LysE family translocator n=1 Tax=Novosphingobium decolorationis TaxID=2698673 RepID=A0ABX8E7L6_9SPHN|nr:LysE family translocator [Novosphingobium decolorationis]QVM84982.1 LysE family translocator [Novosphingobium decolorationis]
MPLQTWWLFALTVFAISATPGPNMLHILTRSVDFGLARTFAAMAGCLSGLMILLTASVAGLSTLLVAVPGLFTALRYAGAAYLVYLGIKAWRTRAGLLDVAETALPPARLGAAALYRGGLAISLSNPKAILFAAALLPQFIDPAQPTGPQFAVLLATFAVIESFWYMTYALGGRSMGRALERPSVKNLFNKLTGGLFVAFGIALLTARG